MKTYQNKAVGWLNKNEPFVTLVILVFILNYALWPLLSAPNSQYPLTVDGMGHLAKIEYIANCLKHLQWPAWFPYWYNGSTVAQYYPPLSYYILIPVQMIFNNVMITFKVSVFASLLIGALGVWCICRRWIGSLYGIWGASCYALQPFLIRSLCNAGAMAQEPIFALTPWLLYLTFLFVERKTPVRVAMLCILTAALILSHAMHAFLICIGITLIMVGLLIIHKIKWGDFVIWSMCIALGAGIAAFWWVPGVTQLETPGVPFLLQEAARNYSANLDWFNPLFRNSSGFYFSLSLLVLSWCLIPFFKKDAKEEYDKQIFIIILLVVLTITIVFSFGDSIPLFRFIPMSDQLVTGRMLSFSSLLAAILSTIFIKELIGIHTYGVKKLIYLVTIIVVMLVVLIDVNPSASKIATTSFKESKSDINNIKILHDPFATGRLAWIGLSGAEYTYFSMANRINITEGWNIEGTPHHWTLWQHNSALASDCVEYVIRNLFQWNTRSVFVSNKYNNLVSSLPQYGFQNKKQDEYKTFFVNPAPSSYFMQQRRDALVIGHSAPGLVMAFPWLIEGRSFYLEDYEDEELTNFNLIYITEPAIKDIHKFESMITRLAKQKKTIIIGVERPEGWPILGVHTYPATISNKSQMVFADNCPFGMQPIAIKSCPPGTPFLSNLDGVWAGVSNTGRNPDEAAILGYKNVAGYKVYFVGMALDLQIKSTTKLIYGQDTRAPNSIEYIKVLEKLMNLAQPYKSIVPLTFSTTKNQWDHSAFSFSYNTTEDKPVLISITHTPRWQAKIDGKPLKIYNLENLMLVHLPAGEHSISFRYSITWVGWVGIVLSIVSLLALLFITFRINSIEVWFNNIGNTLNKGLANITE